MLKIIFLKVKAEYLILVVEFTYFPRRRCSTLSLRRRKGLSKWWMTRLAKSRNWDSPCYRKRLDDACFGGGLVYPRGTVQSNIYRVLDEEGC